MQHVQSLKQLEPKQILEADDFSFAAEHIDDEPSIHIRTLNQFQNIMKRPTVR